MSSSSDARDIFRTDAKPASTRRAASTRRRTTGWRNGPSATRPTPPVSDDASLSTSVSSAPELDSDTSSSGGPTRGPVDGTERLHAPHRERSSHLYRSGGYLPAWAARDLPQAS